MTAISAPPGNLHFPLSLGSGQSSGISKTKSSPRAPSRLSSLHSSSTTSLTNSSPTKTPQAPAAATSRQANMANFSFGSAATTPLRPDPAPPQEKVTADVGVPPPRSQDPALKKMPDRKRAKKDPPQSLYANPEQASLSTPELHLASEPLTGLEDQKPDARFKQRWHSFLPGGRRSPVDPSALSFSEAGAYTSIESVITSTSSPAPTPTDTPPNKNGNDSISSSATRSSNRRGSHKNKSSPESDQSGRADGSPSRTSTFFRRQRRWSATASPLVTATGQDQGNQLSPSQAKALSDEELTELLDDDPEEPLTPSHFTASSTKVSLSTVATVAVTGKAASDAAKARAAVRPAPPTDASAVENAKLREQTHQAALFLLHQLSRLSLKELQKHKATVARLDMMARARNQDFAGDSSTEFHLELLSFWHLISDGVLLCVIVKNMSSNSPDFPDRVPSRSAAAHNLEYYLRTARTVFGLQSSELFQLQDVGDQTLIGLQRIVRSILALRDAAKRGAGRDSSPPRTPITTIPEGQSTGAIPFPTDVSATNTSASPHRRSLPAVQQHRLLAERKLAGHRADSQRASSVVIVEPHRDEVTSGCGSTSLVYRDRKASESVASLTGVMEEECEAGEADVSGAFESPDVSADFSRVERSISPMMLSNGTPTGRPVLATRRTSTDIGLGQPSARAYRLSFDGAASDMAFPLGNGSPRLAPMRRHSSVARSPGLSALNPNRDTNSSSYSDVGLDSTPRVPFPRSNSTYDSPSRRPGGNGRYTSMSGAIGGSSTDLAAPLSDLGPGISASPSRTRPSYRHHRYSSDLHLPNPSRTSGGNTRSDVSTDTPHGRPRVDSEVGSVFTSASFTTYDEAGRPKLQRDGSAPSKHKLIVTEGGRTVTYQIGQCIGRGQFGSVYKALNTTTGMMLAVKRIKLTGKSEKEITQLMKEVDLLKKLEHPSVVKYEGLVRSYDVLNIILEWVESGSLYLTLKNFGPFEEGLCASYVVQILEGLHYLHNQQVVHCDLKAANILTTKKGNIKLSDFGVSLNLQAVGNIATRKDAVGTPNWMAPEVIELTGASTASDIWSLGCTIIEMLTGKPPYHDHNGLSAMYRIVEDDCPPLPPNLSEPLRDFLLQCFQKEPTNRPSAEVLFEHQWLKKNWTGHKQLRSKDSVPFLRRISADMRRVDIDSIGAVPNENAMERSSSSPPETIARGVTPDSVPLRSALYHSSALSMPAPHSQSMDNIHVLPAPAAMRIVTSPLQVPLLRHGSDTESYFGHGQTASMPSPVVDQNGFLVNPSILELEGSPSEEPRPHQFVKISFSKAVQCKICWSHVKKHAVYCEGCGVVCHPSCASNSEAMCPARPPVAATAARNSNERRQMAASSRGETPSPSSPLLPPTVFRLPFFRNRRNSSAVTSNPESPSFFPAASPPLLPPSPLISADGSGANRDASGKRRRRISLAALGRQRSMSPGFSSPSPEVLRSPSEVSTRAFPGSHQMPVGAAQMAGSLSSSGSSTVSRGMQEVTDISKMEAIVANEKPLVTPSAMISTPHLVSNAKGVIEAIRLPRRLSVGTPYVHHDGARSRGHLPSHSISVVYTRETDQTYVSSGPVEAQPDRRRSKRVSKECIVM
ncbi:Protein kinase of the Mitotic Exit Network [Tilletia horrida]|uniref:Protein kinase of the Mitotic Exit Network n=1 Tax=Tilletia horrida TaxID=155126 RepID=A0AAN6GHZ6_9BASI|nr:Protein kinase of the Mitotic Exit Network [Tilletia horrida]